MAVRGNYVGQDGMDMQFSAKGISMEQDWMAAKRLARHLKDHRRVVQKYKYQKLPRKAVVWSDTDFAGCWRIRRPTSGGVVMFASHCL